MVWLAFFVYRAVLVVWMIGGIAFYGTIVNMMMNIIRRVVLKIYIRICHSQDIKIGTIEDLMDGLSEREGPIAPGRDMMADMMRRRAALVRSERLSLNSTTRKIALVDSKLAVLQSEFRMSPDDSEQVRLPTTLIETPI